MRGIAHLIGDYLLQSDWMATEKAKRVFPGVVHAVTYALAFLFVTRNPIRLFLIGFTHFIIDRYRVARRLVWLKNQISPQNYRYTYQDAAWHGYRQDRPDWLAGWLMIVADNTLHLLINEFILRWKNK